MKKLGLALATLLMVACNGGKDQTNIELAQGMFDQISNKAQDWDPKRGGKGTALVPPEGTVPRGYKPYKYKMDPIGAGNKLVNPLKGDNSPELMKIGQEKYEIYCGICHGMAGDGKGTVAAAMILKPPSLLSDIVKKHSDGRIFHILTDGQGVMGSYANQIRHEKDRWAVVNYIRSLQKNTK